MVTKYSIIISQLQNLVISIVKRFTEISGFQVKKKVKDLSILSLDAYLGKKINFK